MNKFQQAFINSVPDADADKLLSGIINNAVEEKLAVNRNKGRHSWHRNTCTTDQLKTMLTELTLKGDMVDVMIVAGMIHARENIYA